MPYKSSSSISKIVSIKCYETNLLLRIIGKHQSFCLFPKIKSDILILFPYFSLNSLFSIPRNKRFVCVNTNPYLRADPITESVNRLADYIQKRTLNSSHSDNGDEDDSDDEIRPFKGFAKPLSKYKTFSDEKVKPNRLLSLIDEHVEEALSSGFDDSIAKYKGKSHFVVGSYLI